MPPPVQDEAARPYGGRTSEERRGDRRRRLLDAGLQQFGTVGFAATSVRSLCRDAGLTERHFYELFADREDLLRAVYDEVVERVQGAVLGAVAEVGADRASRTRAGVEAFLVTLAADPRLARVQLLEAVGVSEALEERRRDVMTGYVALLQHLATQMEPSLADQPERLRVVCTLLVAGIDDLAAERTRDHLQVPLPAMVDHVTWMFLALMDASGSTTGLVALPTDT